MPRPVRAFLNSVGVVIEHWGFKRIQGEMWGLVYLSDRPLTATEIARELGVSKALVSLALGQLLDYRVLGVVESSDGRSQSLVANENIAEAITAVLRLREQRFLEDTRLALTAIEALPRTDLGLPFLLAEGRVRKLQGFVANAQQTLDLLVSTMESEDFAPPSGK